MTIRMTGEAGVKSDQPLPGRKHSGERKRVPGLEHFREFFGGAEAFLPKLGYLRNDIRFSSLIPIRGDNPKGYPRIRL